jgi:tetratricopeptide (TPR) repeat protein
MTNAILYKRILILGAICVLTFICFRYTLNNEFTNWDDDFYVTNDPYIKAFTPQNLKVIFTEDITKNNYHPLCMLSLAVNYHFSQLNPQAYYLTNILIHIANVIFVFLLMLQLCALLKMDENGKLFIAGFASLWFGIHPMHVESVSWIAERKDVLYTFFYVLGLLSYLKYISTTKMKWYWLTFVLFIASCLSKPMAVVFPLSLLCIDVLAQRPIGKKLITEKIIFFLSSLICGGMAFYTQNKTGAIASFGMLTIWERLMYASYGFVMYVVKLFNPTYLSTFYPYPYRYISGYLPGIYYAAPFLSLAIIALPLYLTYKKNRTWFRVAAFGIGFFVANVIFILQFISVGAAIMADRYSYCAYIGLFFMITYFLYEIIKRNPSIKTALIVLLLIISSGFSYLCYERTYAWHDSETLLSDAIEKYPMRALLSYKWLGNYYLDKGNLDKAMENYGVLTTLHAADAKVYDRVGIIYGLRKDYKKAMEAFTSSLEVQNNVYKTYLDRSMLYSTLGDSVNALKDFIVALQLTPNAEKVLSDSSFNFVQRQQYDAAIREYNILLKLTTNNPFYYFYRGVSEFGKNDVMKAIADWEMGMKFNSKDVLQSASYDLSVAYDAIGNDSLAVHYVMIAKKLGYKVSDDFVKQLVEKNAAGKKR